MEIWVISLVFPGG